MFRFLLLLFVILLLLALITGCKSTPVLVDAPTVTVERVSPAEALVECSKPGPLAGDTFGHVVRKLHEALGMLDECSSKQRELRGFIERTQ